MSTYEYPEPNTTGVAPVVRPLGDTAQSIVSAAMGPVGMAASLAMIYHGYKRNNGSVLWALLWGATGFLGVPFAVGQGFGKPKHARGGTSKRRISRIRRIARSRR